MGDVKEVNGTLLAKEIDVDVKKAFGSGTYKGLTITYRAYGKANTKSVAANAPNYASVKGMLEGIETGDNFVMRMEKNGQFQNIVDISKGGDGDGGGATSSNTGTTGSNTGFNRGKSDKFRNDSDEKPVHVTNQRGQCRGNCLSNATAVILKLTPEGTKKPTEKDIQAIKEQILDLAAEFEVYGSGDGDIATEAVSIPPTE